MSKTLSSVANLLGVFWLSGAALAADAQPPSASITISIANRNGAPILAQVLVELGRLRADPRFADLLQPPSPDHDQAGCIAAGRPDLSGRLFDVARCMGVWPQEGDAPPVQAFESAYIAEVKAFGPSALPGVQVASYVYTQRAGTHEFAAYKGSQYTRQSDGKLALTNGFLNVLCAPRITHVAPEECRDRAKVVDRVVYDPEIYFGQTGYRVDVLKPAPVETGLALRAALLTGVSLPPGTRADALRISVIDRAPVRNQALNEPSQLVISPHNPIVGLWASIDGAPQAVDLASDEEDVAPTLLIFDGIKDDAAGPLTSWVQALNSGLGTLSNAGCASGEASSAHLDAVASLLMPAGVSTLLDPQHQTEHHTALKIPSYRSLFFSPAQFDGDLVAGDYSWFNHEGLGIDESDPVVGLVTYDAGRTEGNAAKAEAAAKTYLGSDNHSNILVVSAANWPASMAAPRFAPGNPTNVSKMLSSGCNNMPWPSCLGRDPRVLVVGPSGAPDAASRALFAPDHFVLGSSSVRVAAPSSRIPVLARCDVQGAAAWTSLLRDGTSFGAPLAALLLARMIQLDPGDLRELPEAAIWRVLATANSILAPDGSDASDLVEFGEIDVGRALRGIRPAEIGPWDNAALYESGGDPAKPTQAVVMPYPWNDVPKNMDGVSGAAGQSGIEARQRSSITLTPYTAAGEQLDLQSLDFKSIIRIAKRKDATPGRQQLFDVYYVNSDNLKLRHLTVMRRVRFGPGRLDITNPGFCRSDNLSQPAQGGSDVQPSCLYAWRAGTKSFEPLDLSAVDDIVFPPRHIRARFVKDILPTDLAAITGLPSPWAAEFCRIGMRSHVSRMLAAKIHGSISDAVCPVSAALTLR